MSYQQALQDIRLGYFEAAIAKLDPLLHKDPSQAKLWYAKALALVNLQRLGEAITTVQLAIRLNPSLAPAHHLLGNAYSKLGEKKKAIAAYKQAAYCYLNQQDKAQAQDCLEKIKQFGPQFTYSYEQSLQESAVFLEKISLKTEDGNDHEALQDINWLLHIDPHNVQALAQRGLLQGKSHNYSAALADIALAMQLSPDDPNLRLQRGKIRLLVGDALGAIADFSALLDQRWGNLSEIYCLRGQAYQQLHEFDNAFDDLSNALYIDPQNPEAYKVRGNIYEAMEDFEEALSNYRQAARFYIDEGEWFARQKLRQRIEKIEQKIQRQQEELARIIRVPIKNRCGGTPILEVIFNDSVPCDMVLDTGASMTCLTDEIARLLNIVPTGSKQFCVADGRTMNAPVGYVRSIGIQQAKADNLEVAILPPGAEGLLGQNYLWRYDVRILQTEVELYMR